jgi:hypothetical protein
MFQIFLRKIFFLWKMVPEGDPRGHKKNQVFEEAICHVESSS